MKSKLKPRCADLVSIEIDSFFLCHSRELYETTDEDRGIMVSGSKQIFYARRANGRLDINFRRYVARRYIISSVIYFGPNGVILHSKLTLVKAALMLNFNEYYKNITEDFSLKEQLAKIPGNLHLSPRFSPFGNYMNIRRTYRFDLFV